MTTIISLPGVVDPDPPIGRPDTVRQLRVRVAALEAENARLRGLLDDGPALLKRALRIIGGLPVEAPWEARDGRRMSDRPPHPKEGIVTPWEGPQGFAGTNPIKFHQNSDRGRERLFLPPLASSR